MASYPIVAPLVTKNCDEQLTRMHFGCTHVYVYRWDPWKQERLNVLRRQTTIIQGTTSFYRNSTYIRGGGANYFPRYRQ